MTGRDDHGSPNPARRRAAASTAPPGRHKSTAAAARAPSLTALAAVPRFAGFLILVTAGLLAGAVSLVLLAPSSGPVPLVGLALAFLSGALASLWLTRAGSARPDDATQAATIEALTLEREALLDDIWRLKDCEARHRDVLDTLGDVVTRWREGGALTYANDAAMRLFPDGSMSALHASEGRETGDGFADIRIDTAEGPRWFSRVDVPVRDLTDGTPLVQTILRDVTDRRRVEEELVAARNQAETASASKSRFLATVSHEIRTPLNGILGMASLLRDTRLTAEQHSYVDAVHSSGEILLLLIDEVLDLSKIEAGRLELSPARLELTPLVEGVVELLSPRAQAKGLEIGCHIGPEVPTHLVGDGTRLRQILFNLAGNGLKFTETGGVTIDVARTRDTAQVPSDRLLVTVRDTGIGFTAEDADRLFQEFEQIDHGPARRFDGAGLGLAISQRLVNMMGGTIAARATAGAGAEFRVNLPLTGADGVRPQPELAGQRICLITQSQVEGPLIARQLGEAGARVTLLSPGDEAIDEALADADLILLDQLSVTEAGGWLAGARAIGIDAPAVVLVTPAERDRLPRLRAAGFGAYLIRPVRSSSLLQVTKSMLESGAPLASWDLQQDDRSHLAAMQQRQESRRPLRLLVAEDNDINRMLTEALLRKLGHESLVVGDGAEALKAFAEGNFDAVLMDLHMPGIDGITAIRRLRARERELALPRVAVFAVTADVTAEARDAALEAGADAVLAKPLDPDLLRNRLSAPQDGGKAAG
ncbi:response regulator [Stappia taiwanensis]|uniref:Sensory/regulatory protein RpfC n=1 Tax=Stappia taiwanensis TaxID=992267 RepID=A0A838XRY9_9HYPH|nr:ATP-binding protein [Stappia taiwanensis]MBA4611831.1 response regulator [Stappia taiwanensis]GGF03141.1 hybrid sensor histidine kinase/response regulator [Stappia taiwanensis]